MHSEQSHLLLQHETLWYIDVSPASTRIHAEDAIMSTTTRIQKVDKTAALTPLKTDSEATQSRKDLTQEEINARALEIGRQAIKTHAKTWEELAKY